jgi:predicted RNase H-like HicB family nuclease
MGWAALENGVLLAAASGKFDVLVTTDQRVSLGIRRSATVLSGGYLMKLTAIIEAEGDGYVSLCPELDIASQGESIEQARDNLREALELFFECASPEEVKQRLHSEVYVTQVEVATG